MLRAIHDLDITDKHKALIPATHYVGIKNFQMVNASGPLITINGLHVGPIEDGKVLMSLPPAVNIKVGQYFQPSFEITFGEGQPLAGKPILEALHNLAKIVNDIIDTVSILISQTRFAV